MGSYRGLSTTQPSSLRESCHRLGRGEKRASTTSLGHEARVQNLYKCSVRYLSQYRGYNGCRDLGAFLQRSHSPIYGMGPQSWALGKQHASSPLTRRDPPLRPSMYSHCLSSNDALNSPQWSDLQIEHPKDNPAVLQQEQ